VLTGIFLGVGSGLAIVACNLLLDRIYIHLRNTSSTPERGQPEYRLPLVIFGALSLPPIVFLYGLSAHLHWPLPLTLTILGFLGFTMMFTFLPILSYVVDAFRLYSASALTALIVTRCLMSTFLPLCVGPLVKRLGWAWAFGVLAVVSFGLAPIPISIYKYGGKWRQGSRYTQEEEDQ
jgi:MFS family permease